MLSPILAIMLHYSKQLTAEQWEKRQVAACGLSALLEAASDLSLDYAIIEKQTESSFKVSKIGSVDCQTLLHDILARTLIVMLRDQFKDNEDITVMVPVRSQCMRLISALSSRLSD